MKNTMLQAALAAMILVMTVPATTRAQDRPERFQRREAPVAIPVAVFHSPQAANLPTAETLAKGEWLFEISHRFFPPVSEGADALWGFDGPVLNRLGLAYAASDRLMFGVLRTNLFDNLELNAKARLWEKATESASFMMGAMGGIAWNTDAPSDEPGVDDNEMQAYGQLMLNVLIGDKLALGFVPGFLHNPVIDDADSETVLVLGGHGQIYVSEQVSFFAEWIKSRARPGLENDSGSFGVELETGGHFFKILLTNQQRMNPTQFLGGTPYDFTADEWRVGFNITRLLAWG